MSKKKQAPRVTRRQAREWAVQMLCQADLQPDLPIEEAIAEFWKQAYTVRLEEMEKTGVSIPEDFIEQPPILDETVEGTSVLISPGSGPVNAAEKICPPAMRAFTEERVRGVLSELDKIDKLVEECADHWRIWRLGTVERNVLRLACWELRHCPDVPQPVVMNEAIDLAKYFSNAEAGRFVNGVLEKLRKLVNA